jgi:hypothetical protein
MPASFAPYDFCTVPLLGVALSDVTIKGITFEGEHLADGYPCRHAAIIYSGSSGTIENCSVSGFRPRPYWSISVDSASLRRTTQRLADLSRQVLRSTFRTTPFHPGEGADALPALASATVLHHRRTRLGSDTTNGRSSESGFARGEVRNNTITDHALPDQR